MDIFDGRYYKLNKWLLAIIGLWPYQDRYTRLRQRLFVTTCLVTVFIPMVVSLFTVAYSMEVFLEIVSYLIILIIVCIKYVGYCYYTDHLMRLYEEMQRDWDLQRNKEELQIMHETAEEGRKYCFRVAGKINYMSLEYSMCNKNKDHDRLYHPKTYEEVYVTVDAAIYYLSSFVPKIMDILIPLEEPRPAEFLFRAEYFVDPIKYYYPILLHMILCMSVAFTILVAADSMYMAHVYYACGLFLITGYHMKQLFNETLTDKEMSHRISYVVHYHRKAMRFVNAINTIHEWEFMITAGLVTANISLTSYIVVSAMTMSFRTLKSTTSALTQMCHLFLDIYPAQKIINYSSNIYQYVYNSKWYLASANTQKMILMIMSASVTPCKIMPIGLFILCVETYSSMLQAAVSYFTVLHSMTSTN